MIFNIGLPKTGTTPIDKAFSILGIKSIHDPFTETIALSKGNTVPVKKLAENNQAFSGGCSICYKQLDVLFPGSQFILSTREFESWLDSCRRWFHKSTSAPIRQAIFGHSKYNEDAYAKVYKEYHEDVKAYFKDRDLLVFDIEKNGWNELCPGKEIPDEDFPHENKNKR